MEYLSIEKTFEKKGTVKVRGWIHRIRKMKDKVFIVLRDSSDVIQCVVKDPEIVKIADELLVESSLEIEGKIYEEKRAPTGYEIEVSKLNIVHPAEDFPIGKDQSPEFLLDQRHLWLRSRKMTAIMKIRSTIFGAIHEYFRKEGFYEHQSPTMLGAAGEGGSSVFEVNYFGKKIYLAQTWQLHAEAMMFALEKIYTLAPSFRAEKSSTSRHLTEYWHAEMEVAWCNFKDLQDHVEKLVKHIVNNVLKENKKELELLKRDLKTLEATSKKSFPRMTYDEVLELLKEKADLKIPWGKDLRTIEEDKLSALFDTPVIVTDYPKKVKAFYMKESPETIDKPENKKTVQGFDLIGPEGYGELVGASQREENIEIIKDNLTKEGEDLKNYEFYLDTRRYGSIPHGGFGMGVERVISWICGLDNIKDAIAFPRTMTRMSP
ncbi:asparagine--tRNA ligase [Candidatus Woesearchaeota archaeon]|jgi:asparaginyl-tRNA synthetase|nr:asparagine--tRNA ligase [Candidatus Woesearchaeota archaeon]MBT4835481.1 asparagine--tRNA ligase [Candidatus Woesearchaeota archaeon]MBT6734827.1 asparagine--tRNA ligase [Candidatus Woesearchaeota archaeon]MBT7169840.1 asparagine--tRNA ligase [Candidatus Woesearchaeota archaeon]MBT7474616.1 asparagine--tRNA ligase [Candidatus Woesearchaeota archaeon]